MSSKFIGDLASQRRILLDQPITSKKKALDRLAEILHHDLWGADEDFSHSKLQDAFIAREKLGSTALEHGVAIPHCRVKACDKPMIALITLREPIQFEASNGMQVNLICGLVVPEEANQEHLDILASLVQLLGVNESRDAISSAKSPSEVHALLKAAPLK